MYLQRCPCSGRVVNKCPLKHTRYLKLWSRAEYKKVHFFLVWSITSSPQVVVLLPDFYHLPLIALTQLRDRS